MYGAILHHIEEVAKNTKTFWWRPERAVHYTAGQFTELYLPHNNPDERGVRRWFTLSSSPSEPLVGTTTKFAGGHGSTFKQTLLTLKPGAKVTLAEPMGDFVLPKDPTIPLVFVAAGLGITPVRSMIKWLSDTGERRQIHLIYAVHSEAQLAFAPLFETYGLGFMPIVKEPGATWRGQAGPLKIEHILSLANDDSSLIYLSGPEHMVEASYKALQAKGLHPSRLVADYFPGYLS